MISKCSVMDNASLKMESSIILSRRNERMVLVIVEE